jgi:hypothetical protein
MSSITSLGPFALHLQATWEAVSQCFMQTVFFPWLSLKQAITIARLRFVPFKDHRGKRPRFSDEGTDHLSALRLLKRLNATVLASPFNCNGTTSHFFIRLAAPVRPKILLIRLIVTHTLRRVRLKEKYWIALRVILQKHRRRHIEIPARVAIAFDNRDNEILAIGSCEI